MPGFSDIENLGYFALDFRNWISIYRFNGRRSLRQSGLPRLSAAIDQRR